MKSMTVQELCKLLDTIPGHHEVAVCDPQNNRFLLTGMSYTEIDGHEGAIVFHTDYDERHLPE